MIGMGRQLRALALSPFVGQRLTMLGPKEHYTVLERLTELIEGGKLVPAIEQTYPLSEMPNAMRHLEAGRARGKLVIPADPTGQLLYTFKNAQAPAGPLTVESPNKSNTPHDISVVGKATGKVVTGGGVSTISVNLTPGKYMFECTVPGHAQAGMKGTLTVK